MLDYSNAEASLLELVRLSPLTFKRALSIEAFTLLSEQFPNIPMERAPNGKVSLFNLRNKGDGNRIAVLNAYIGKWSLQQNKGEAYGPSIGILLLTGILNYLCFLLAFKSFKNRSSSISS